MKKLFQKLKKTTHGVPVAADSENTPGLPSVSARGDEFPLALNAVKAGLTLIQASTPVFTPLQSVAGGLLYFANNHGTYLKNKAEISRIRDRLNEIDLKNKSLNGSSEAYDGLDLKLQPIAHVLQQLQERSKINQYAVASDIASTLSDLLRDITDAITDYQTFMISNLTVDAEIDRIEKLPRADHASYDQDRIKRCHPGTRVDILANLHSWAIDNCSPSVYWLNGHAGSGKSTIAHSFCSKADTDGTLGASFFCSRDEAALSNLQTIFPTLSFQLAVRYPIFRSYVAKALKEDPTLGNRSLSTQLVRLLVGPLEYSSISTVLVIDALDECRDLEPVSAILSLLSGYVERIPNVKWLITGRPEDHIRTGFDIPSLRSLSKSFILHDVAVLDVNKDIALYLRASLSEGVKRRRAYIVPIPWPEEEDLEALTRQCDGLFIFASTAVMYIFSSFYDPQDRLKDLCRSDHGILSEHGQYGLDCLYAAVLEEAYKALRFRPTDKAAKRALTMLMSAIALSFDPLTSDDLADLLNTKSATIMSLLCHLHAVIKVPVLDCHPISLYHKSFFDYVTDGSRCTNVVYYVNPDTQHCVLAEQCLQLMNSRLRRNTCDLPRYAMNSDLDLKERRKRIGGALVYACTYWISHLREGKISQTAIDFLEIFVSKRLVQWMEVMSLVDRFSSVISGLHKIHDALSTSSFNDVGQIQKLLDVIYDGRKFASEFRPAVQASASHLYHSALPFAPDASVIRQMHVADIVSEANVTYGKPSAWEVHDTEIYDKATPRRQAFSSDGKMICVHYASRFQQTSCVFDVATGERLHTFQGTGICFSPDSRTAAVAVGDKSAKIWDLQTGAVRAIINPDEYNPYSYQEGGNCALAFSPSGKYLLIPSKDQMQVWDVSTGEMMWTTTRDDMPPSTLCSTSPNQEPPSEDFCPDRLAWLQEEPPLVVVRHYRYCLAIHNFADRSVTRVFDVPDSGVNDCYYEFFFGLSVKHGILGISDGGILYLRNPYTNQLYGTIEGKRAGSVTFSDHLPIMLFIGEFYDISNPHSPRRLKTEPRYYSRPVFSPTQSLIATVATPYIYIFPLAACFDMESCDASTPFETVGALGQSYQRLLSVSEDAKEVLYIVWQPKATKLHLSDDGITETEVQVSHINAKGLPDKPWNAQSGGVCSTYPSRAHLNVVTNSFDTNSNNPAHDETCDGSADNNINSLEMETNDDAGTECKSDPNEEDIEKEGTCSEESLSVDGTGKLSDAEEGGTFEGEAVFRDSLSSDGTIVCSSDGDETAPLNKSVITLHTNSSQSTSASTSDPMTPVLDDIIHPIDGKEEDSLLTTIMNSVEGGTTFEASLETMEAMGQYWHPQVSPTAVTSTGRFFFTSPSCKTVVYVRFRDIGAKVAIRVTVHSLPDRRRLATREWLSVAVAYSDRGFDNGWVTMDMDTGVLTIFNAVGVSGEWKLDEVAEVAKYQDRFFDESEIYRSMSLSRSFQLSTSEEAAELDAKLRSQLSDRARTKVYPVITNDDGWILNHKNEPLLWLPVKAQAKRRFRTKWRWAQQRLILSGNVIGSRGLMVIDFNGVDMEAPNALQAVEKLTWGTHINDPTRNFSEEIGWKRLIISGLNVLE